MRRQTIGFLAAAAALLATATGGAAQARPDTDFSQSSSSSGPTCLVGGVASDCEGGSAGFPVAIGIAPVFVATAPVFSSPPSGGIFGGSAESTVTESVDVDQSSRGGTVAAR